MEAVALHNDVRKKGRATAGMVGFRDSFYALKCVRKRGGTGSEECGWVLGLVAWAWVRAVPAGGMSDMEAFGVAISRNERMIARRYGQ
jgi:hypothetical protein